MAGARARHLADLAAHPDMAEALLEAALEGEGELADRQLQQVGPAVRHSGRTDGLVIGIVRRHCRPRNCFSGLRQMPLRGDEHPPDRRRRARARARLGDRRKPARRAALLRARQSRHRRRWRERRARHRRPCRGGRNSAVPADRAGGGRAGGAAGRRHRRRPDGRRHQGLRADQGGGAARRLKGFTKDLCAAAGIPTAAYRRFTDAAAALGLCRRERARRSSSRPTGWPRARA